MAANSIADAHAATSAAIRPIPFAHTIQMCCQAVDAAGCGANDIATSLVKLPAGLVIWLVKVPAWLSCKKSHDALNATHDRGAKSMRCWSCEAIFPI